MWICNKCATRHETAESRSACRRSERRKNAWNIAILVAVIASIVAVDMGWNQYVHGDWRCAFSRCVKVTK